MARKHVITGIPWNYMPDMRNVYSILVGKPAGKRPLGRPRRRWEDNTRMYLREIGLEGLDWMHLEGCCEHDNEPSGSLKSGASQEGLCSV
jgi:hypothetical protein